jgi:hypothetical protein
LEVSRQNSLVAEVPNRYFGSRVTTRAELNEILQYTPLFSRFHPYFRAQNARVRRAGRGFDGSDGKGRARREATSPPMFDGSDDGSMAGRVPRPP